MPAMFIVLAAAAGGAMVGILIAEGIRWLTGWVAHHHFAILCGIVGVLGAVALVVTRSPTTATVEPRAYHRVEAKAAPSVPDIAVGAARDVGNAIIALWHGLTGNDKPKPKPVGSPRERR